MTGEWSLLTSNNLYNGGSSLRADIRWSSFRADIQNRSRPAQKQPKKKKFPKMLDRCFGKGPRLGGGGYGCLAQVGGCQVGGM